MRVEQSWGCDTETDYEFFDEIQWGVASYDFDLTRIYRQRSTGNLFAADDAGCSCPSPFENTTEERLTPITTPFDLQRYLELDKPQDQRRYGSEYQCTVDDINRVVLAVGEYLATRA